jgi:APA family basic amino acid/polyamine antiporter
VGEKQPADGLQRHFGLIQATALNVTMIVGAGVFVTIPLMLQELPGPYAVLGWIAAGALILVDSLIWSELGTMMPGSGGSYLYLLESYGRQRWGRLFAFLFIWQFLVSGPLELASGLIAMDTFAQSLHPAIKEFNDEHKLVVDIWKAQHLGMTFSPVRGCCFILGLLLIFLLYRDIRSLGRLTITFWLGVLGIIAWVAIEGGLRFDPARAFDFSGAAASPPTGIDFARKLGKAMILAMYSYLGYYNVCYIGDEVCEPGKTIPRAIFLSAIMVTVLFTALHLAMLGVVSWQAVPTAGSDLDSYSLPADMMKTAYGDPRGGQSAAAAAAGLAVPAIKSTPGQWAATLVTILLIWSCFGAVFAGLLGYSRIPYGAAKQGHFFALFGHVHPRHRIPHIGLLFVGGLTLFWSFFELGNVINALITTRILEQFIAQIVGLMILRQTQPDLPRPFRIWLYPLPCGLALVGWLFLYFSADLGYIVLGLSVLSAGFAAFLIWSHRTSRCRDRGREQNDKGAPDGR